MLELYHWEPNGFFLKPLIALEEKAARFESRWFDPTRFEQFAAGFPASVESRLTLEREGPVLVADGAVIASTFFMLEYIAEALPGPSLCATLAVGSLSGARLGTIPRAVPRLDDECARLRAVPRARARRPRSGCTPRADRPHRADRAPRRVACGHRRQL